MIKWLISLLIFVIGGVWYSAHSAVVFFHDLENRSAQVLQKEAQKSAADPAALNYAFRTIAAVQSQEKIAAPASLANETNISEIREKLRALPLDSGFDEKRQILNLLEDKFSQTNPRECADIAVESLNAAVKLASHDESEQERLQERATTRYGAIDSVYYSLHLLLSLPLDSQELTTISLDVAKSGKDRDIQLMVARTLVHRFPETRTRVFESFASLGISKFDILQTTEAPENENNALREPAQEIE